MILPPIDPGAAQPTPPPPSPDRPPSGGGTCHTAAFVARQIGPSQPPLRIRKNHLGIFRKGNKCGDEKEQPALL